MKKEYSENMTHLPDPIERGEARAEAAYEAMIQPDGRFKCACGELFDPEKEGGTLSPDPYSMPFCGKCFAAAFASPQEDMSDLTISGARLTGLISNCYRMLRRRYAGMPLWAMIGDLTGHGCNVSMQLCRQCGFEPNQNCGAAKLKPCAANSKPSPQS